MRQANSERSIKLSQDHSQKITSPILTISTNEIVTQTSTGNHQSTLASLGQSLIPIYKQKLTHKSKQLHRRADDSIMARPDSLILGFLSPQQQAETPQSPTTPGFVCLQNSKSLQISEAHPVFDGIRPLKPKKSVRLAKAIRLCIPVIKPSQILHGPAHGVNSISNGTKEAHLLGIAFQAENSPPKSAVTAAFFEIQGACHPMAGQTEEIIRDDRNHHDKQKYFKQNSNQGSLGLSPTEPAKKFSFGGSRSAPLSPSQSARCQSPRLPPMQGDVCDIPALTASHIEVTPLRKKVMLVKRLDSRRRLSKCESQNTFSDLFLKKDDLPVASLHSIPPSESHKENSSSKEHHLSIQKVNLPRWLAEEKPSSAFARSELTLEPTQHLHKVARRPSLLKKTLLEHASQNISSVKHLQAPATGKMRSKEALCSSLVLDTNLDLEKLLKESGAYKLIGQTQPGPCHKLRLEQVPH